MIDPTQIENLPKIGAVYADDSGRELEITAVEPGERLGREIRGLLSHGPRNGHRPADYSTDLITFDAIWATAA